MGISAEYWVKRLNLEPHPEGGAFRETYRSQTTIPRSALPERFSGERAVCTAICFLLRGREFSAFHRIASDEMWHFYCGSGLTLHMIDADGSYTSQAVGLPSVEKQRTPQALVPAGVWFAATVDDPQSYSLVGCTVSPGFNFADFELGDREMLIQRFPKHEELIKRLTKEA